MMELKTLTDEELLLRIKKTLNANNCDIKYIKTIRNDINKQSQIITLGFLTKLLQKIKKTR